jgi:CYTH domain-containing protein
MLDDDENMPEWVQSKITKATDYIDTVRDYMKSNDVNEGSETWEAGYKRRVVKTTDPDHKKDGHKWRIKGKDKAHLSIKLYKEKPSQQEFNKQMKRVAGHEFGG